jgi:hypothetical protein
VNENEKGVLSSTFRRPGTKIFIKEELRVFVVGRVRFMKKASAPKKAIKPAKAKPKPVHKAVKRPTKVARPTLQAKVPATTSRMRAYNLTRDIPEEKFFVLANGQPVKNVAELAAILDQLEDHVFHHHVSSDRNDFHNWIRDVFEDVELAKKVSGVQDKKHLQLVIYRHIAGHD